LSFTSLSPDAIISVSDDDEDPGTRFLCLGLLLLRRISDTYSDAIVLTKTPTTHLPLKIMSKSKSGITNSSCSEATATGRTEY
jgi:hypothetical protein